LQFFISFLKDIFYSIFLMKAIFFSDSLLDMAISIFELLSIGIGPSSSHTVGPMRAALRFLMEAEGYLPKTQTIVCDLYGSLALTGHGHGTDVAIMLGLAGERPESCNPEEVQWKVQEIKQEGKLKLLGMHEVPFIEGKHLLFHKDKQLPYHPNGLRFRLFDSKEKLLFETTYYSVGGGFILSHEEATKDVHLGQIEHSLPYPFKTGEELLFHCKKQNLTIAQVMMENEKSWRDEKLIKERLILIWNVMMGCIERGCHHEGILPGGLNVKRRAPGLYRRLKESQRLGKKSPVEAMDWVSLWALAVNEENAAGGRVVTAPTNGASGVIPSVIRYYDHFTENPTIEGTINFMLTAGAIGILYKEGASISAAEMGCMGEVGVACSMAAAGLAAALGATAEQIENAAEIGMEHNLGLTCDPIKGLVQIPCIERNTMGANKAINAAYLALHGDGTHRVSLDQVIKTMRQTGIDMQSIYKETSLGGLAVNVPEC
jgi:L-serine dehydratase